jgi:cytochrome c oxidase assembly factor CtaG
VLAPSAENELAAWSPEWVASAILLLTVWVYVRGWRRGERDRTRLSVFLAGMTLLAIAIASPLEALDDSFLSVHMVQHFLLMMAAPPLLLAGHPFVPFLRGLPRVWVKRGLRPLFASRKLRRAARWLVTPPVAGVLFACAMISWHIPNLFELALASPFWHDIEHATFFWGGILFWWPVIESRRWPRWASIPYLLFGDLINTAVSAFFVFSGRVLYPSYVAARASGSSALDDQVLAGLIMWVPGSVVYLVPAFVITMRVVAGASDRPERSWPRSGHSLR